MHWPRSLRYFFNRENLNVVLFVMLPVVAYFIGITTHSFFHFENATIVEALSVLPTLLAWFNFIVQTQGADAGNRYYVVILFLFDAFLVQWLAMIFLGFEDFINLKRRKHFITFYEAFILSTVAILVYAFFFASEFTINLHSRMGKVMNNTDFRFAIIAFFAYIIRLVPYLFGLLLARIYKIFSDNFKHN